MAWVSEDASSIPGAAERKVKSFIVRRGSTRAERVCCFRYDQMGVLFTVLISDNTLESGLLQVRSRDTTIKETVHISETRDYISTYISAAHNL